MAEANPDLLAALAQTLERRLSDLASAAYGLMPVASFQERREPGLLEVVVSRQRLGNALTVHNDERDAIG